MDAVCDLSAGAFLQRAPGVDIHTNYRHNPATWWTTPRSLLLHGF
jgi:hypothetical protein